MCLVSDSSVQKDAKHIVNKPQSLAGRGVALQAFLNSPKKSVPVSGCRELFRSRRRLPSLGRQGFEGDRLFSFHPTDTVRV